jgi:21S rRNA (GM2251-2'-O)-methyltransferase
VPDPVNFLTMSKHEGFRILATSLPPVTTGEKKRNQMWGAIDHFRVPSDMSELSRYTSAHPVILLLGSESSGVPEELTRLADATVSIERMRETDEAGIDSLNVSVAAGIIFSAMGNGQS